MRPQNRLHCSRKTKTSRAIAFHPRRFLRTATGCQEGRRWGYLIPPAAAGRPGRGSRAGWDARQSSAIAPEANLMRVFVNSVPFHTRVLTITAVHLPESKSYWISGVSQTAALQFTGSDAEQSSLTVTGGWSSRTQQVWDPLVGRSWTLARRCMARGTWRSASATWWTSCLE